MRVKGIISGLAVFVMVCLLFSHGTAQTISSSAAKKGGTPSPSEGAADPLGRNTPQGTIVGFMTSAQKGDYERALKYLDTKKTGRSAHRLVDQLQIVLRGGFSGKIGLLTSKTEGRLNDKLPPSKELVGTIETDSLSLDVFLERTQRGNDPPVWLFSSETLEKIPQAYEEFKVGPLDAYIPRFMIDRFFLWFPLWQWAFIIIAIPLSFIIATLLTRLLTPLLLKIVRRVLKAGGDHHVMTLTGPLRVFILALAAGSISLFSRSILTSLFWAYAAMTLAVLGATWLCLKLIHLVVSLKERQWAATATGRVAMIQLVGKLSKALLVIICFLVILHIGGINITAALTGLGIGGIAIAFAAQKTLENLFGGIMIISDQPVRVGDFCRVGTYTGTIETIGLRSTYIRTLDRTLVSIPNGQLAGMSLENYAFRDKLFFHHVLTLQPDTTPEQLTDVLARISTALQDHSKVEPSTLRVNLTKVSESGFVLDINAYLLDTDDKGFIETQEMFLLKIMEIVDTSGTALAFSPKIEPLGRLLSEGRTRKRTDPGQMGKKSGMKKSGQADRDDEKPRLF